MNDKNLSSPDYIKIPQQESSKKIVKANSFFVFDEQTSLENKSVIQSTIAKKAEEDSEFFLADCPSDKSFRERMFSPINSGSIRASIMTIVSSMIGVGFLTLPAVGKANGYIPCAVFIILSSFMSQFGNLQLGIAYRITRKNTYTLIVEEVLGKFWALINQIFMFLYLIASSTSYFLFGELFSFAAFRDNGVFDSSDREWFTYVFMGCAFVISFLGTIPKKITALRYATQVSSVIVFYVVICIIIDYFTIKEYFDKKNNPKYYYFNVDMALFSSYCLSLFSVVNQFSIVNIISELERPTPRRIFKVIHRSAIFPLFIYLTIGQLGYATYGSMTPAVVVDRDKIPGTLDLAMTIGRILLCICLFTGIIIRSNSNATNLHSIIIQIRSLYQNKNIDSNVEASVEIEQLNSKNISIKKQNIDKNLNPIVEEDEKRTSREGTKTHSGPKNTFSNELIYDVNSPTRQTAPVLLDTSMEPSTCTRIFQRMLMALIPAVQATFLTSDVIRYISMASGFLAPPFVIIFPAFQTITLHKRDKLQPPLTQTAYYGQWVYVFLFGVGSYVAVVINAFLE